MKKSYFLFVVTIILSLYISAGAQGVSADRTLSPYFRIMPDSSGAKPELPLESTKATVKISGVIADVTVIQRYKNSGKTPIEAVYVFPASTRAAVYAMQMRIGGRTIQAQIKEKAEARRDYENAKRSGISASLLEQERPNVFTMNVANILPGDVIDVELKYSELLIPEEKYYSFVFPTIVGPRYQSGQGDGGDREALNPAAATFDMELSLNAGMQIEELFSDTHKFDIIDSDADTKLMKLVPGQDASNAKDVIIRYRLAGDKIRTGLLLNEGGKENFFLLMVQPTRRVETSSLPDREFVFIIDVSGSMKGFPMDVATKVFKNLAETLKPTDKFNILLFSGSAEFLYEQSKSATKDNIDKAVKFLGKQHEYGGTELLPALKKAFDYPDREGLARSFVVITDGFVTVEQEAYQLIMDKRNKANVFSFGIGASINRYIIEGMAKAGSGEPFFVTSNAGADSVADKFVKYIYSPVMTDIKVEFDGFLAYDVEPKSIPDMLAERPILVYGKYRGDATGNIRVSGVSDGRYVTDVDVLKFGDRENNEALRYLWARNKIAILDDWAGAKASEENKEKVTQLGLSYNLLTKYTSFIAVDSEQRRVVDSLEKVRIGNGVDNQSTIGTAELKIDGIDSEDQFAEGMGYVTETIQVSGSGNTYSWESGGNSPLMAKSKKIAAKDEVDYKTKEYYNEPKKEKGEYIAGARYNRYKFDNAFVFPMQDRRKGIYELEVAAEVYVSAEGSIDGIVMKDKSQQYLADAVKKALEAANMIPAQKNGKAAPSYLEIKTKMEAKERAVRGIMFEGKERTFTELRSGYRVLERNSGTGAMLADGDRARVKVTVMDESGKPLLKNNAQTGSSEVSVVLNERSTDNPYGKLLIGRDRGTRIIVQLDDDLRKELNLADLGGSFIEIEVL